MTQTYLLDPGSEGRVSRWFGGLAGRYRALRDKLKHLLERRDGDYSRMTAFAQELAQVRRTLRAEISRRRRARRKTICSGSLPRDSA